MNQKVKLVVFVPETHADAVRKAIGIAKGGVVGNYSFCSFSTKGVGRFVPEIGAMPAIGKVGDLESVVEERIEVTCDNSAVGDIIKGIRVVHPYEEIPIDIYNLN